MQIKLINSENIAFKELGKELKANLNIRDSDEKAYQSIPNQGEYKKSLE